jgi:hypothetical protein
MMLLTVLVIPNLGISSYEDSQGPAFHVNHCPLLVGLEIFDPAQVTVFNCLTDVDEPLGSHWPQSLLLLMREKLYAI